jgi:hypothetical protein
MVMRCRYFVMERATGLEGVSSSDLFGVVSEKGSLSEEGARFVLKQLLAAIAHCHSLAICHRCVEGRGDDGGSGGGMWYVVSGGRGGMSYVVSGNAQHGSCGRWQLI